MPSEQEMRSHRCCFTGHRAEKLSESPDEIRQWLTAQITNAVADGFLTFITGMAMGVDLWAGDIVAQLREQDPRLHLIAAVPWPGFPARWKAEQRELYEGLLKRADLVRYISKTYHSEVFRQRNMWMIDHSARVIAYYNGAPGGTKDMIEYAQNGGLDVFVGGVHSPVVNDNLGIASDNENSVRDYPLNLIDAILDCEKYRNSRKIAAEDVPEDFDRRLMAAASTIKDDRAYELLTARFRDHCTLQSIGDWSNVSRERIRQLLEKYMKCLRNPDILRFLNCGIEGIPEKTSPAKVKMLQEWEKN